MPSGGGRSGGSSHFGGGGRSGGSSHFGSNSSGNHSGGFRRGPHYTVFMGRRVYISGRRSNVQSLFSVLMVIAIFVIFFAGGFTMINVSNLGTIEHNYKFYHSMVETARQNPDSLIVTATADFYEYYHNSDYYRINYSFTADNGKKVEGYTFYVYTYEEAVDIVNNQRTFDLAVSESNITEQTDSVPMDFAKFSLEDDVEYLETKKGRTISIVVLVVGITTLVGCIVGNILVLKTAKANGPDEEDENESSTSENSKTSTPAPEQPKQTTPTTWKCAYCGKVQSINNDVCKQCGAARQE